MKVLCLDGFVRVVAFNKGRNHFAAGARAAGTLSQLCKSASVRMCPKVTLSGRSISAAKYIRTSTTIALVDFEAYFERVNSASGAGSDLAESLSTPAKVIAALFGG